MDRESIKEAFFQLKTRDDVASILGISERSLRYFLYKIRPENMYHTFKVPKKDGATREIAAPEKRLKMIQRKLADVLSAVYEPKVCAYGFITEKSNIGNAAQHVKKSLVFNIDFGFREIHDGSDQKQMADEYKRKAKEYEVDYPITACFLKRMSDYYASTGHEDYLRSELGYL